MGAGDELFFVADQRDVAARADVLHRCLRRGHCRLHASHLQIIRDHQPAIADFFAQDVGDPFPREGSRRVVFSDRGIGRMRDHHECKVAAERAVRIQVFAPKPFPGFGDDGELVMRVQIAFTQAGKVLAGTQHARLAQTTQKLAGVNHGFFGVFGDSARTHHRMRSFKSEVKRGREIGIEAKSAAGLADQTSMFPEQAALPAGEHICRCGRGTENIAETIDLAAFHVHTAEHGRGDEHLAFAQ